MPVREVEVGKLIQSLSGESPSIIKTPMGLAMIEIQGELNIPNEKPVGLSSEEDKLFKTCNLPPFLSNKEPVDVVKIGSVEIEEESKRVTLFISTTQRLVGKIVKLDPPLGLMKLSQDDKEPCEIVDVITSKMIFSSRPLPIM